MAPLPTPQEQFDPATIDEIIGALRALALCLEEAAMDASPEDAARLRYIAGLIGAMIADLRSGVAFVQIAARFSALVEELLALLGRLPASVARIAVARFMDVMNLFGRLLGGASASPYLVLLGKALLVALVALLAHLGTRWVLEHCRYKGVRLWDLLDDNWVFDWWYGVEDEDLSRCEKLDRAYLAYRK